MKKIMVVDLGSAYAQMIARKIRSLKVYCEVVNNNAHIDKDTIGIVLAYGYKKSDKQFIKSHLPVLDLSKTTNINSDKLFKDFLFKKAKAKPTWTTANYVKMAIDQIKKDVGKQNVLCALSGGVDSAVTAALIDKAIGKQLTCVFVDTGLLRKNEGNLVQEAFVKRTKAKFIKVDASDTFFKNLKGVTDPEAKRKIIGKTFIDVFKKATKQIKNLKWLAQGTIYPDIIESGDKDNKVIKSHHNVGGLPKDLKLKLCEPLKYLFKDEVRVLGKEIGLPDKLINRQPFPGPGIGVRVVNEVTRQKVKLVQESDAIVREEIEKAGLNKGLWQYFTILPGVKTVGCKNASRSYEYVVAIRIVKSVDAMTATWADIPSKILRKISNRICNEVNGINRVVYDITDKPSGTIEWE